MFHQFRITDNFKEALGPSFVFGGLNAGLGEFWTMNEPSGDRVGTKNGIVLVDNGGVGSATGIVNSTVSFTVIKSEGSSL